MIAREHRDPSYTYEFTIVRGMAAWVNERTTALLNEGWVIQGQPFVTGEWVRSARAGLEPEIAVPMFRAKEPA